ncbi:hypothetical protein Mapa_001941 [Marchantia paleacea]|nr:hypothetical protein Mapa_001941 [Marchantia paleacea]
MSSTKESLDSRPDPDTPSSLYTQSVDPTTTLETGCCHPRPSRRLNTEHAVSFSTTRDRAALKTITGNMTPYTPGNPIDHLPKNLPPISNSCTQILSAREPKCQRKNSQPMSSCTPFVHEPRQSELNYRRCTTSPYRLKFLSERIPIDHSDPTTVSTHTHTQ